VTKDEPTLVASFAADLGRTTWELGRITAGSGSAELVQRRGHGATTNKQLSEKNLKSTLTEVADMSALTHHFAFRRDRLGVKRSLVRIQSARLKKSSRISLSKAKAA
jgi:hypothetical protein